MGERGLDLTFDLETAEQRHPAFITVHPACALRHHLSDEVLGLLIHIRIIDEDLVHVLAEIVTDCADDDVAFLVDEKRSRPLVHRCLDRAPQLEQVVEIPLQLFLRLSDPRRTHDKPHTYRNFEGAQRLAQLCPILALDASRDPARPRIVGHEDEITSGKAWKSGKRGSLLAALLLLHLHEKLQPFRKSILDGHGLTGIGLLLGVVLACDLLERQEAVPLRPVVDERGFEAGLDPCDLRLVDARFALAARGDLDVEVVEALTIHHRDPALLGLGRVDQHSFHGFDPSACGNCAAVSGAGSESGKGGEIVQRYIPQIQRQRRCSYGPTGMARIKRSYALLRLDSRSVRPARRRHGLPSTAWSRHCEIHRNASTIYIDMVRDMCRSEA